MSGSVRVEPTGVRITMVTPAGGESGQQASSAKSVTTVILNASREIAQGSLMDLQDAQKQLENDLGSSGMTKGLVYTMLGAVDAKLAQGQTTSSTIDTKA